MKYRQIILFAGVVTVLVFTAGCSRVENNSNNTSNTNNANTNRTDNIVWQEVNFSLSGYSYSLRVPKDWQIDYTETDPSFLNVPQANEQPILTTGLSSPQYSNDFKIISNNNSSLAFISVEVGMYKNTDTFDAWYQNNHNKLINLHTSNGSPVEKTITVGGKNGRSIAVSAEQSTDDAGSYPAMRNIDLYIPMDNAVLNIYIGGETWLMDHFQSTIDEIISSVAVD